MQILFENGKKQLIRDGDNLLVAVGGRDWFYPKTVREGLEKMLTRDWDATLDAMATLIEERNQLS